LLARTASTLVVLACAGLGWNLKQSVGQEVRKDVTSQPNSQWQSEIRVTPLQKPDSKFVDNLQVSWIQDTEIDPQAIPGEKSQSIVQPLERPEAPGSKYPLKSNPELGDAGSNTEKPSYFVPNPSEVHEAGIIPDLISDFESADTVADLGCNQCGQSGCSDCSANRPKTRIGRFIQGVYQGICCPDPCYQPQWTMLANAGLFTESVRPQTRQRFQWEYNDNVLFQDRAEYLWARSGSRGPAAERSINYHELSMYVETGSEKFSFFVRTPYRSIYLESGGHFAGFSDITTGTKTLLHDTELLQVALQFETHIPTANALRGLSNGHVALEPSLIFGVQMSERSFLQAQIGEWIPIAGDSTYAGALLKYSTSYNRLLSGKREFTSLIGTLEFRGISFQDGAYTNPFTSTSAVPASNESVGMMGGGLRLNICNKLNVGLGGLFRVSEEPWADATWRTEIQFRH